MILKGFEHVNNFNYFLMIKHWLWWEELNEPKSEISVIKLHPSSGLFIVKTVKQHQPRSINLFILAIFDYTISVNESVMTMTGKIND